MSLLMSYYSDVVAACHAIQGLLPHLYDLIHVLKVVTGHACTADYHCGMYDNIVYVCMYAHP
jgi:hypothetical protein